jgi:cytochrome c peroxidase
MRTPVALLVCAVLVLSGCRRDADLAGPSVEVDGLFQLNVPPGFPPVPDNAAYPMTDASVRLGKALFFDPRLSRDGTVACASCHFPDRAFSDTVVLSVGIEGRLGMRNATPLFNLAWHPAFFRDGGVPTLEQLAIAPIHDPNEMDFNIHEAAERLMNEDPYAQLSLRAYGEPLSAFYLVRALASYQRTLLSGWSRYDRFRNGDQTALTEQEQRGLALFNSPELGCGSCHGGFDLTDHQYHNIGLYALSTDPGRERISLDPQDHGRFKTPSLRNVALTAPYMHDGTLATLEQVVDHFASGGEAAPNKSPLITGFDLSDQSKADLIAFLHTLTDERPIDQVEPR